MEKTSKLDNKYPCPMVSVVVTSFNQSATIAQTLESILNQKCTSPIEIIIGDDFSTDGTQSICLEYQKRYPEIIRPIFHKENIGVGANFALIVRSAKGKYISVCAADDFWHNSDKLQIQVDFLENHPDYGLIYTDYDKLNIETGKTAKNYLKTSHKTIYEGTGLMTDFFSGKVPALTVTIIFRKDLFDEHIPVDDYIKYQFPLEDWPTWLILSKYTKIGYLPVSTATYRYGHESISNPIQYDKVEKRFYREQIMYKYLCNRFPDDLFYSEAGYLSYVNNILLSLAYKKNDYSSAKKYAKQLKELGSVKIKVKMAQHLFTFKIFAFLKDFRYWLTDIK